MNNQAQAQIFLAGQRGCSETDFFRSFHTFNFGPYRAEGREPFGALCLLNDDTLWAGASLTMQVEQPTEVILLPIAGGIDYTIAESTQALEPGQAITLSLAPGMTYTVSNPYETEAVNCLQLWLTKPVSDFAQAISQTEFDLATRNVLLPLFGETNAETDGPTGYRGFIGRYEGRQEGTYGIEPVPAGHARRIFVFVLQGVFELANRLLHEKDGLSLTYNQQDVLEFEALSNDAMLILIDQPAAE